MKKNKTILQLPFNGSWYTVWGGDTEELNRHSKNQSQKYAFDFLIIDKKGNTHKGKGKNNSDYYCFSKKILVPADGIVIEAVDGIRENKIGSTNKILATGNLVIIKHSKNEISVLAHLKQGSVKVKTGEKVKKGQVVGLCGNSGNSSEPHLHYQLQDNEIFQDAKGIKCYFQKIELQRENKKELKNKYSPIKGDIVNNE